MPVSIGSRRADQFPMSGAQAALFCLYQTVEVLVFENELVVKFRLDPGEFVHRGKLGPFDPGNAELDERKTGFAVKGTPGIGRLTLQPTGKTLPLPNRRLSCSCKVRDRRGDIDQPHGFRDDPRIFAWDMNDHRHVICLQTAIEGKTVT